MLCGSVVLAVGVSGDNSPLLAAVLDSASVWPGSLHACGPYGPLPACGLQWPLLARILLRRSLRRAGVACRAPFIVHPAPATLRQWLQAWQMLVCCPRMVLLAALEALTAQAALIA